MLPKVVNFKVITAVSLISTSAPVKGPRVAGCDSIGRPGLE